MNIQLRYAAFKDLYKKLQFYSNLIDQKNYSEINSKKYREKIKSLINNVQYEITNIDSQAATSGINLENSSITYKDLRQCRIEDPDVSILFQEIQKISLNIFRVSTSIAADYIYNIEIDNNINPEWILPTSTFKIVSESVRDILGDDVQIIQDFLKCDPDNTINIDYLFINILMTSDRINETLENWQSVSDINIQNRYSILEQALSAHKEGKFFLSVSTLIPQVEGIIRDIIENNGRNADFGGMSDDEIRKAIESLKDAWTNNHRNTSLLILLDNIFEMVSRLYVDDRQISSYDGLYRHGICHGRLTNFGTVKNSLKLILILDRLICLYDKQ
ncbi:hypothetical protein H6F32_18865 [Anabaena sp. FACHB-1237]|uniref:hypothetical protein n=1 Tax=Anabaena sp. FACHB-1237 TaxID=2692769 RepID=UPI001680F553|nr:hypothetical protein [Anabaena sp. FACHB-1237]MBD2139570.1 hypothetical protein [Anabaena sp. FACHB-1237]